MEFLLTATSGPVDRYTDKATLKQDNNDIDHLIARHVFSK